uniref:Vegetative cell wall protein gp1 n=1 Tax=Elaeis guineensis var. tenera TaxID=51953 RepID=A0A6I9QNG4_ELAGV|nr:vegetative cell wall protein gp1 [Elaeis guineensis]
MPLPTPLSNPSFRFAPSSPFSVTTAFPSPPIPPSCSPSAAPSPAPTTSISPAPSPMAPAEAVACKSYRVAVTGDPVPSGLRHRGPLRPCGGDRELGGGDRGRVWNTAPEPEAAKRAPIRWSQRRQVRGRAEMRRGRRPRSRGPQGGGHQDAVTRMKTSLGTQLHEQSEEVFIGQSMIPGLNLSGKESSAGVVEVVVELDSVTQMLQI